MAGRRPKPARVKELAGNPGKRALKRELAHKTTGICRPPDHLGRFGKSLWRTYLGEVVKLGIMIRCPVPVRNCLASSKS